MPATWTAPRTWITGELVTHTLMNQHLRDNLEYLKTRTDASDVYLASGTDTWVGLTNTGFSTGVLGSYVDMSASLARTFTPLSGRKYLLALTLSMSHSAGNGAFRVGFNIAGTMLPSTDGIIKAHGDFGSGMKFPLSAIWVHTASGGSQTWKPQWYNEAGSGTLNMAAGTIATFMIVLL